MKSVLTFALALVFVFVMTGLSQAPAPPSVLSTAPTGLDMKMVQSILDKRSKEIDARDVEIEILTAQRDFYRGRVTELEIEVSKLKDPAKPTKN